MLEPLRAKRDTYLIWHNFGSLVRLRGEEYRQMLQKSYPLGGWTGSIDSHGGDFNNVLINDQASFFFSSFVSSLSSNP